MSHGIHLEKHPKEKESKNEKQWKPLLEYRTIILISPNQDLSDGTNGLYQQVPILFCDCGVFGQDVIQIPEKKKRKEKVTNWHEIHVQV